MTAPTALLSALAGTTAGTRDATGEVSADAAAAFVALLTQAMPAPTPAAPIVPGIMGTAPEGTGTETAGAECADAEGSVLVATDVATAAPVPTPAPAPTPAEADAEAVTSLIAEIAKLQVADSAEAAAKASASAKPSAKSKVLPPQANGVAEDVHAAKAAEAEGVHPESPRWGQVAARRLKHVLRAVTPRPVAAPPAPAKPGDEANGETEATETTTGTTPETTLEVSAAQSAAPTPPSADSAVAPATIPATTAPAPAATTSDSPAPASTGTGIDAEAIGPQDANPTWLRHRMNPVTAPTIQMSRPVPKPGTTFGAQVRQETGEEGSPAIRAALLILDAIRTEQGDEAGEGSTGAPTDSADSAEPGTPAAQPKASGEPALPANAKVVAAAVAALHAEREDSVARPRVNAPTVSAPETNAPAHPARPARPEVAAPAAPAAPKVQVDAPRLKPEQPAAERDAESKTKAATPKAPEPATPAQASITEAAARTMTTTADRGESSPQVSTDLPKPATETAPGPRGLRPTGHQVTIELDGNTGDSTRIRVTVHGSAVRATVLSGAEQSGRLSLHADELTRALEDRGFKSANVSVRTAGEPAAIAVSASKNDAGNSQHEDRPAPRGSQRDAATRDGQRRSATDDRPRQQRRPDPEEE